jgi:hypothetical protein
MNMFLNRSRTYGQSGMGYSGQSKPLTVTRILVRQGSISPAEKIPLYRGEVVRTRFFTTSRTKPGHEPPRVKSLWGSVRSDPGPGAERHSAGSRKVEKNDADENSPSKET